MQLIEFGSLLVLMIVFWSIVGVYYQKADPLTFIDEFGKALQSFQGSESKVTCMSKNAAEKAIKQLQVTPVTGTLRGCRVTTPTGESILDYINYSVEAADEAVVIEQVGVKLGSKSLLLNFSGGVLESLQINGRHAEISTLNSLGGRGIAGRFRQVGLQGLQAPCPAY